MKRASSPAIDEIARPTERHLWRRAAQFCKGGVHQDRDAGRAASIVADVLVWANLRGQDGHGVMRIPRYVHFTKSGEINVRPNIRVTSETPALVVLDADRACGPIAMTRASSIAIEKARAAGVGLTIVRATTHTAALGYYTQAIACEGMAGIAVAASIPNMAYHGARASGVSTSPVSIAVPGGARGTIVFDMGTGIVEVGNLN